jgi:RHS repeat-associated protein
LDYQAGSVNTDNYDEISYTYNFEGVELSSTRVHHRVNSDNVTIINKNTFDHVGRLLKKSQQIDGAPKTILTENIYNEIEQLKEKNLGGIYRTRYSYNERGWLRENVSDFFSFQLKYEDATSPQYNGNIGAQVWGSGSNISNEFIYNYDKLNRLTSGISASMSEIISYDLMGNIETLKRDSGPIRNYFYQGNQLKNTNGIPTLSDYQYDSNGNAVIDGNSGKSFTYNSLNLPATITGGLSYIYAADGSKLRKSSNDVVTDYIDGIQYVNGSIDIIQNEVGLARRTGSTYSYEYNLQDHLGNVRTSFYKNPISTQLEVLQRDNYYPFGLRQTVAEGNNKFLYNGKELQEELGQYDYGARFYDPVIGRFTTVDPFSDKRNWLTPYNYVQNNPIIRIDPTGAFDEFTEEVDADGNVKRTKISNLGGDKVDFTHIKGGQHNGEMRIESRSSGKEVYARTSRGIEGYTQREKGTSWNDIYDEFMKGTGPENSLITNAGMTQELIKSPIFADAFEEYVDRGAPDKASFNPSFNYLTGPWKAGDNMIAQMIGKASFSFYNLEDQLVITAMDSKSKISYSLNPLIKILPESWINDDRKPNRQIPQGTTRQTYLMILKINKKK